MTWLARLSALAAAPERTVAGLMSGTSADAIDVALCRVAGAGPGVKVTLLAFGSAPYPEDLRREVTGASRLSVRGVSELHAALGEAFADAFLAVRSSSGPRPVDLIGSHGQTVYHFSGLPGAARTTLQLGDGDRIAERTGLPVVSDFRQRDVAAGGEGAPLTPYADALLFAPPDGGTTVVLNLGGIANVTVLRGPGSPVAGFDTGPANAPLDRLARLVSGGAERFDPDGAIAAAGAVDGDLLALLEREDDFVRRPPPKSTGFETYGDPFVEKVLALYGRPADPGLLSTVTEFVARSVVSGIRASVPDGPFRVVAAGGGTRNGELMRRLRRLLAPADVSTTDALGVPSDARETMAFALLANDALFGLPTNLPSVTGAARGVTSGKLSFPPVSAPHRPET